MLRSIKQKTQAEIVFSQYKKMPVFSQNNEEMGRGLCPTDSYESGDKGSTTLNVVPPPRQLTTITLLWWNAIIDLTIARKGVTL